MSYVWKLSYRNPLWACAVFTLIMIVCTPVTAHHSVGVFETTTPIVLKGTIVDVYFANPHSAIIVEVTDSDGNPRSWAVENSGTLNMTYDRGFNASNVLVGDPVEACGYAPKPRFTKAAADAGENPDRPRPPYWKDADNAITGRLVVGKWGVGEHWSHYGSLDVCLELLGLSPQQ